MLPFATRTDMLDALKKKDTKIATVEAFLHALLQEHGEPGVRDHLKKLWTKYVRELHDEEEEDDHNDGEGGTSSNVATIRSKAQTPPPSPPAGGAAD